MIPASFHAGASDRSSTTVRKKTAMLSSCPKPSLSDDRSVSSSLPCRLPLGTLAGWRTNLSISATSDANTRSRSTGLSMSPRTGLNRRQSAILCARRESIREPSSHGSRSKLNVSNATRSFLSATSETQMVSVPDASQASRRPFRRSRHTLHGRCFETFARLRSGSPLNRTWHTGQTWPRVSSTRSMVHER